MVRPENNNVKGHHVSESEPTSIFALQSEETNHDHLPPLLKDRSFWGLALTQFLGAFNDNVFKQIVLLLALPVAAGAGAMQSSEDMQGWATFVFSLPFVLFSGFAGYLSDRFSKAPIIVYSKVAEIVVMLLGLIAFSYYGSWGWPGTWTVLFLLATQSTFFGPGKYGMLPELFRASDLPRANGLILMSTFLAIIFGVTFAGKLMTWLVDKDMAATDRLWIGSLICIVIAVVGTLTSLMIRKTPIAQPNAKLTADAFGLNNEILSLLRKDKALLMALLVSCVFWMVASIAMPAVNRVGVNMLALDMESTSILVGMIAVGIMIGAPLGGFLCRVLPSHRSVTIGLWGIVLCLVLLGFWKGNALFLSVNLTRVVLILLGISAAIYSIPLQVFLQERPPNQLKGRMIATMNQANFLGMMMAGPLYQLFLQIAKWLNYPVSSVFWMIGIMVVPLAIFYRMGDKAKV
jgi:acyl-[acyl-carrier-protein]-phospholipid O-acyltransferase/long-chain-fatty-acid--[acyl-carrier-protein] ligase